ncbi:hypothetical protein GGH94_002086 [Coemansia aciculifera]|uniref:Lysine--tRNA ligase n=1 Tax=Coemansia aciculifera TaxID=417176 RepID=A0A9W8IPP0_9FUNG|nr:hypothetical protein GGH94_002086 [Coemansia aciculifera]
MHRQCHHRLVAVATAGAARAQQQLPLQGVARAMSTIASADKRPIKAQREQTFAKLGLQPYPRYTPSPPDHPVSSPAQIHTQWADQLEAGVKRPDLQLSVQGRIRSRREASKKLFFYDIEQGGRTIQVVVSQQRVVGCDSDEFLSHNRALLSGDIIRAFGHLGKTNTGEISVFATQRLELLAPCLHTVPSRSGLVDTQKRFRNRYLDLLVNGSNALQVRARVLRYIREFLDARKFVEVETPILSPNVGGASARPFVTQSAAAFGDTPLFLRVAPELYLKQLVIGGMDRVYELGRQFRNEGIDADHNPEFTTCEFYMAYATLDDLIAATEDMLRGMVQEINDSPVVIAVGPDTDGEVVGIDFGSPFARIDVTEALHSSLPELKAIDINDPCAMPQLAAVLAARQITCPLPHTMPRLLDRLIGHYIEPLCTQPTFLLNHPAIMSPLAKSNDAANTTAARFELFVNGKEIVNAYEELNDPREQRQRFTLQAADREAGDVEVPPFDNEFCDALEFALPPTAGWGMGVDRVVALLAGVRHLRETIAFPIMRPDAK